MGNGQKVYENEEQAYTSIATLMRKPQPNVDWSILRGSSGKEITNVPKFLSEKLMVTHGSQKLSPTHSGLFKGA